MAELKAMLSASNIHSPMLSDKSSYQPLQEPVIAKPSVAKELLVNDEDCVAFDNPPPSGKKVKYYRSCNEMNAY